MTLKYLSQAIIEKRHSNVPPHCRPVLKLQDNSTNALTKSILAYFDYKEIKAWRQSSEGRFIQGKSFSSDSFSMFGGRTIQEKGKYIPRSKSAVGIGDISVILPGGRFLSIEIKYGKDSLRPEQKEFSKDLTEAGGLYIVVKTWEGFIAQIEKILK